ncbi:MAG: hypothetical protein ACPLW7_01265 [Minisyncoccia bacterium]
MNNTIYLSIILLLLIPSALISDLINEYYKLERVHIVEEYLPDIEEIGYKNVAVFNDYIGFISFSKSKSFFFLFDIVNDRIRKYQIILPQKFHKLYKNTYNLSRSLIFNNKYLVLRIGNQFFFAKFFKWSNKFKLKEVVFPIEDNVLLSAFDNIKLIEDTLILIQKPFFRGKTDLDSLYFIKLSLIDNKILMFKKIRNIKCWIFSLFYPPKFISFSMNYFVLTDVCDSRLIFLDYNGEEICTIEINDSIFKKIDFRKLSYLNNLALNHSISLKTVIDSLRQFYYKEITTIENIDFLTDSLILIQLRNPVISNLEIDTQFSYWMVHLNNTNEKFVKTNIFIPKYNPDKEDIFSLPLRGNSYFVASDYIVIFSTLLPFKPKKDEPLNKYLEKVENFYKNNNLKLSIVVFRRQRCG